MYLEDTHMPYITQGNRMSLVPTRVWNQELGRPQGTR